MLGIVSEDENQNKIFKPMAGATLGQGVPLGAWCSFEKDVAPSSNWLMAGTTFDASVYPALNLYLGTNVVPSRYDHSRLGAFEDFTISTDANNPTVIEYDGFIYVSKGATSNEPSIYLNGVSVLSGIDGRFNETIPVKKGDTAYAVYWANVNLKARYYTHPLFIKATSIASDSDQQSILAQIQAYNTYSTEETLTGKTWIDGKPIYKKVVMFTNSTSWGANAWALLPNSSTDVPNAEQVTNFSTIDIVTGVESNNLLAIGKHGDACAGANGIYYYSTININLNGYIIEYTKTND